MRISSGYGPRPAAGGGFETFSWYFMRISAIGLFFLAILHLIFNHVTTDVACTSYQLVALRYANPYWRVFDWLLLTLFMIGTVTLITFQPVVGSLGPHCLK